MGFIVNDLCFSLPKQGPSFEFQEKGEISLNNQCEDNEFLITVFENKTCPS